MDSLDSVFDFVDMAGVNPHQMVSIDGREWRLGEVLGSAWADGYLACWRDTQSVRKLRRSPLPETGNPYDLT